jgi:hypothetical protein
LPYQPPTLNPTAGALVNAPIEGLQYRRDPTRPGGGVFIARGVSATDSPDAEVELDGPGEPCSGDGCRGVH